MATQIYLWNVTWVWFTLANLYGTKYKNDTISRLHLPLYQSWTSAGLKLLPLSWLYQISPIKPVLLSKFKVAIFIFGLFHERAVPLFQIYVYVNIIIFHQKFNWLVTLDQCQFLNISLFLSIKVTCSVRSVVEWDCYCRKSTFFWNRKN